MEIRALLIFKYCEISETRCDHIAISIPRRWNIFGLQLWLYCSLVVFWKLWQLTSETFGNWNLISNSRPMDQRALTNQGDSAKCALQPQKTDSEYATRRQSGCPQFLNGFWTLNYPLLVSLSMWRSEGRSEPLTDFLLLTWIAAIRLENWWNAND